MRDIQEIKADIRRLDIEINYHQELLALHPVEQLEELAQEASDLLGQIQLRIRESDRKSGGAK